MIFKIDETLQQLGLSTNYDSIYFMTIGITIFWITFSFIMCITIFIFLRLRTNIFVSIYMIFVTTYSITVNSINVFEFYIFVKYVNNF